MKLSTLAVMALLATITLGIMTSTVNVARASSMTIRIAHLVDPYYASDRVTKHISNFQTVINDVDYLGIEVIDDGALSLATATSEQLKNYNLLFVTVHGEVIFSNEDKGKLVAFLENGGTLFIDACSAQDDDFYNTPIGDIIGSHNTALNDPETELVQILAPEHSLVTLGYNITANMIGTCWHVNDAYCGYWESYPEQSEVIIAYVLDGTIYPMMLGTSYSRGKIVATIWDVMCGVLDARNPNDEKVVYNILLWSIEPAVIVATIDIDPDTLNLKSKGRWITAYIELPEGHNVSDIDISTIKLNDTTPADPDAPTEIGDYDEDGILDLMVKFDRQEVIALLSLGEATLTITGEVNGTPFEGSDTIRVIDK